MEKFQPIIKWSGSKRSQCEEILKYFPNDIDIYYEPFCGGCSMLMGLINSNINVNRYECSDINEDLINLWNCIKYTPNEIYLKYNELWNELNKDDAVERKRKYFEEQRSLYNKTHDPFIFFFIMRTTTNGMPRYNNKGEFNNSFHLTRNGIEPQRLLPILTEWSDKLKRNNVNFLHRSYESIVDFVKPDDYVYMDPPYFNTKGMYFGKIDFDKFFETLSILCDKNIKYSLSFDGKSGNIDNTFDLPINCYKQHFYIKSGNSSFKRYIGNDKTAIVYESLYVNYET